MRLGMTQKLLSLMFLGCMALPSAHADMTNQATSEQEKTLQSSRQSYLQSQGIALPDQGVQVVPRHSIQLPADLKKQVMKDKNAMLKQGYVETSNPRILELRDINHTAIYEKKKYQNNTDPMSTHLRDTASEIKLAYYFHEIPAKDANSVIGFAPVGTYVNNGWSGIVELFTKQGLGNCNYEENNLKLMHATIRIPSDIVTHEVHDKITTFDVRGNKKDGFLYTVEWYDDGFSRKLECVAKVYSPATLSTIIEIARRADH